MGSNISKISPRQPCPGSVFRISSKKCGGEESSSPSLCFSTLPLLSLFHTRKEEKGKWIWVRGWSGHPLTNLLPEMATSGSLMGGPDLLIPFMFTFKKMLRILESYSQIISRFLLQQISCPSQTYWWTSNKNINGGAELQWNSPLTYPCSINIYIVLVLIYMCV